MDRMKALTTWTAVLLLAGLCAQAAETDKIVSLYKENDFSQVCKLGMREYYSGNQEPHFAAMVGMACAKSDAINPLGSLQRSLVETPALRSSATYFSTLVLAKRLLYQYFIDGIDLGGFTLPRYEHVLSVVFDHVARGDFKRMGPRMIRIEAGERSLLVSVSDDKPEKILVDEYLGAKLLYRHWYQ